MSTDSRPTLFLIDGYALIYRAFFAMVGRPLTTSRGENTSATWGIANFLFRLIEERRPEYAAWVHDAGSSFRSETFPDYKATREKLDEEMQEDFDTSLERVTQLLEAFSVRLMEVEGYEADDVIGTMAREAVEAGFDVVIISGDKDFYQLISDQVSLLNPGRGGPAAVEEQMVTPENAEDRMGVPPEQVTDYLALVGDSSDNVPGVKGIGAKTARKLLEEYGSLDEIISHANDIKGKRPREALQAESENAVLSRRLVTIQSDVPLSFDPGDLRVGDPDWLRLQQLFAELEFHTLLEKIPRGEGPAAEKSTAYQLVSDPGELENIVGAIRESDACGVDVLLSGPDPLTAEIVGLGLATPGRDGWYLPLGHSDGEGLGISGFRNLPQLTDTSMAALRELLEDEAVPKVAHDVKRLLLAFRRTGVGLGGAVYDSMLASFLIDPGRRSHELAVVALEQLGLEVRSSREVAGKGSSRREPKSFTLEEARDISVSGADVALRLRDHFAPQLASTGLDRLLEEIEMPLVDVLAGMESRGILVDHEALKDLAAAFGTELQEIESGIYEEAGTDFNINSTPQLRHILFEKLQLPVLKKTKTGPSTDAEVLEGLAGMGFALPSLLLRYREVSKLKSTYVDPLPAAINPNTGRVHTRFNQIGAATGRLSSSDPNLQNIPVRTERGGLIRKCFVAPEGSRLIVADYSQVELRLLAHLSGDELLIEAFRSGGDVHRETASVIFEVEPEEVTPVMRERAKTINFATIYGQGPYALSRQLGIEHAQAKEFIGTYFERFRGVRAFLDEQVEKGRKVGYVETIFGRRRYIPELRDRKHNIRAFGERTAMNSPIQGSAADLIKVAMIRLADTLRRDGSHAAILLQVHDELVLEVKSEEAEAVAGQVRSEMQDAVELSVPVVVEVGIGENWLDAKK